MTVTDFDVHGLVALRLLDAPARVVDDVALELGAPQAAPGREPDLVVRFVDRVEPLGYLRRLGLHDAAYDDEHFYLLDAQHRRARVDPTRLGERCEIVCEREVARIPLLVPVLGLYLAAARHVLLHAASFVHRGRGVLVAGWQKGGKTETLLPFTAAEAYYVADEWTVEGAQGMYGLSAVARLWDWHLRELPQYWERITPGQRARLRVWRGYHRIYRALPAHDRVRAWPVRLLREASTDGGGPWQAVDRIPPPRLFGDRVWTGPGRVARAVRRGRPLLLTRAPHVAGSPRRTTTTPATISTPPSS